MRLDTKGKCNDTWVIQINGVKLDLNVKYHIVTGVRNVAGLRPGYYKEFRNGTCCFSWHSVYYYRAR